MDTVWNLINSYFEGAANFFGVVALQELLEEAYRSKKSLVNRLVLLINTNSEFDEWILHLYLLCLLPQWPYLTQGEFGQNLEVWVYSNLLHLSPTMFPASSISVRYGSWVLTCFQDEPCTGQACDVNMYFDKQWLCLFCFLVFGHMHFIFK